MTMNTRELMRSRVWVLLAALLTSACGGSGGSGSDSGTSIDPTQPAPVALPAGYQPALGTSWQWQLSGNLNTSYAVDLYDIDLFDRTQEDIQSLQAMGRKVICYFSAGSWEDWRDDADTFPTAVRGAVLEGWSNERWLDIRSEAVFEATVARLDLAAAKGCDGIEPDNMDGYVNASGFPLSADDQLRFNRRLANAAHERGLAVGLKNDLDQIPALVTYFDFAVNEQCHEFDECEALTPFIEAGKPVFNAEYANPYRTDASARALLCDTSHALGLRTLVLPVELDDSFRFSCD